MQLAQDRVQLRVLVLAVLNLRVLIAGSVPHGKGGGKMNLRKMNVLCVCVNQMYLTEAAIVDTASV
jgi:hypothetical protein